jgi:uncharacterized protein YcbK (DUF882 family)
MNLTKNFKKSEFNCKCGCEMPNDVLGSIRVLAEHLQAIRDASNAPILINSAYRCPDHNKAIGGVSNSQHVLGKASDINIKGWSANKTADFIEGLHNQWKNRSGGLGRYNNFVHIDIRNAYSRWDNRN